MVNTIYLGPLTIHMYGVMIAVGFIAAFWLCDFRAGKKGLKKDIIEYLLYGAIVGGLVGTRLVYYIVSMPEIIKDVSILWDFSHGYVVYGGILGGILADFIVCKWKKVDFLPYFDLVMPAVAMAQGFGRIGCFFAGCCYGIETTLPIGFTYHSSAIAPVGVKLIPTQLISSLGDFLIFALLLIFARKKRRPGNVAGLYLLLYGIGRFFVEFLRNDHRGNVGNISTSQFISIPIVLIGVFFLLRKKQAVESQDMTDTNSEQTNEESSDLGC